MQKFFSLMMVLVAAALTGCGGGGSDDMLAYTNGTSCHPKFYNKAYNRSYDINGITYRPQKHYEYSEIGLASYYGGGDVFHGRKTSNGETFDMNRLSAAHKTLPIPCVVLVTNLENGRTLKLKINDRGPFIDGRIIDVSRKSARLLGFEGKGLAKVKVEALVNESFILADNMAKGRPSSVTPFENEVVLAGANSPQPLRSAPIQLAAAQPKAAIHSSRGHGSSTGRASVYAQGRLPDITLTGTPQRGQMHLASAQARAAPVVPNQRPTPPQYTAVASPAAQQRVYVQRPPQPHTLPEVPHQYAHVAQSRPQVMIQNAVVRQPVPAMNTVATAGGKSGVFIQAGTFAQPSNAYNLVSALKQQNPAMPVKLQNVNVKGQQMVRVLIGPFKDNTQARLLASQMQNVGGRSSMMVVYE